MGRKLFSLKSISFILLVGLLTFNMVILSNSAVRAQAGAGVGCKWLGETCPSGMWREVCVVDGGGNDCTCGGVTRSCDGGNQE